MNKYYNVIKRGSIGLAAAVLCIAALAVPASAEETSLGVVETAYGSAQGVPGSTYEEVTLFKGMPYAAPPVGDLRWHAPEDPESWDGVQVFDTYAPAAAQWAGDMNADPWKTDFYYEEFPEFSEDCLYLNIATSATTGDEAMPVYVWFHGGGLNHGYSYEVECDPEALAAKGVVVVEVGHRLGVYGYMALPQLDEEAESGVSGNYTLMDCIKAVEWVKDNIAAFGGDPDNITLGGQSGGTDKVAAFFMSEQGASLVDNVIWQTGLNFDNSYDFKSQEELEEQSIEWLKACGLTGDETLEELRAMDTSVFMGKEEDYMQAPQKMVVDGQYVEYANLLEAYEAGRFEGVNILLGTNLGEQNQDGIGGQEPFATAEDFYAYYKEQLGDLYDTYDFENLVQVTDENAFDTARTLATYGFNGNTRMNLMAEELFGQDYEEYSDGNVYVYLLSHFTPGRNEDYYWAWHSSDLWYTFGSLRDVPGQRDWEEWDYELADIVTSYWANFMKNGDPNGEGLDEWLPSGSEGLYYMNLGEEDTLGCVYSDPEDPLTALYIDYCRSK